MNSNTLIKQMNMKWQHSRCARVSFPLGPIFCFVLLELCSIASAFPHLTGCGLFPLQANKTVAWWLCGEECAFPDDNVAATQLFPGWEHLQLSTVFFFFSCFFPLVYTCRAALTYESDNNIRQRRSNCTSWHACTMSEVLMLICALGHH